MGEGRGSPARMTRQRTPSEHRPPAVRVTLSLTGSRVCRAGRARARIWRVAMSLRLGSTRAVRRAACAACGQRRDRRVALRHRAASIGRQSAGHWLVLLLL